MQPEDEPVTRLRHAGTGPQEPLQQVDGSEQRGYPHLGLGPGGGC